MMLWAALWGCKGEPTPVEPEPCDGAWPVFDAELLFGTNAFVASIEADPAPGVGPNDWVIDVRNASDVPVSGASVILTPTHIPSGDPLDPPRYTASSAGSAGRYRIPTFDLPREGGWAFEFLVASGMQNEVLLLELCIQE